MVVVIHNVPSQTVGRVHAATTVKARRRVCNVQKSSSTRNQRYHRTQKSFFHGYVLRVFSHAA
eukprot:11786946-Karenia_brevis.AAC.1